MTRLTKAEYRKALDTLAVGAERRMRYGGPRVTEPQAARLQRNAADPAKARRGKTKRCPDCRGKRALHGLDCWRCEGVGKIPVSYTATDLTLERQHVQPAVEDYLRAEGLVPIPINSGAATIIGGRACLKGVPDLVTWIPAGRSFYPYSNDDWAVPCFIECKRPKGGRYSQEQLAFRDRALVDGCLWIGATCVEDVMRVIPPRRAAAEELARAGRVG